MHVIVCGAGVIGCATAYYLAKMGVEVTVVERHEVAAGASGKSGGFIARDWCDGNPMATLAHISFELHDTLAGTLPADYGYRRIETLLVAGGALSSPVTSSSHPRWLDGRSTVHSQIGSTRTTAQIEPKIFTKALLDSARSMGAHLITGTVRGVATHNDGRLKGIELDGLTLEADAAVLALGPWTEHIRAWARIPHIMASKGHSIVLRPSKPLPAQALFVEYPIDENHTLSPEIVPRPDGEVYVCGLPDPAELPEAPEAVQSHVEAAHMLHAICADLSAALADAELVRHQACYRPIVADALPVIGEIDNLPGAFIATGHNCWGMLTAPGTGLSLAELLTEGVARSIDLKPFSPYRSALAGASIP